MLKGLIKTARPHQWVKNLFVVAPLVFAKGLSDADLVVRAIAAFFCFSFAASAIYLLNDVADVEADRVHPVKKNRPIASGVVSVRAARMAMAALALTALVGGALLGPLVAACLGGYLLLNVAYTYKLKRVPYIDALSCAYCAARSRWTCLRRFTCSSSRSCSAHSWASASVCTS